MSVNKIHTTNMFKVKNARIFRKELEDLLQGVESELRATERGFSLWIKGDFYSEKTMSEEFIDLFQKHLRDETYLLMTSTSLNNELKNQDVDLHIISPIAYKRFSLEEYGKEMQKKLYPKYMHSSVLVKHYKTKLWLEKDKKYKALKEERTRLRSYLVIEHHDGRKVRWPKEYFYEGQL